MLICLFKMMTRKEMLRCWLALPAPIQEVAPSRPQAQSLSVDHAVVLSEIGFQNEVVENIALDHLLGIAWLSTPCFYLWTQ